MVFDQDTSLNPKLSWLGDRYLFLEHHTIDLNLNFHTTNIVNRIVKYTFVYIMNSTEASEI